MKKRILTLALAAVLLVALVPASLASDDTLVTEAFPYPDAKISVDGQEVDVNFYALENGTFLLSLGDIARALGLNPGWENGTAVLTTKETVENVRLAGPFASGPSVSATYYPNVKVTLDGDEIPVDAYGINGNIYLGLRDLADALGLAIDGLPPAGSIIPDPIFYGLTLLIIRKPAGYVIAPADLEGITSLTIVDDIANLTGIEYFTALTRLYVFYSQLTELDVSNNTALEYLTVYNNQLTVLNASNNPALEYLSVGNSQLTELDVSNSPELTHLSVAYSRLTELDVSHNPALEYLNVYNNQLTELDVSHNPVLEYLNCGWNYMISEDKVIGLNPTVTTIFRFDPRGVYTVDVDAFGALYPDAKIIVDGQEITVDLYVRGDRTFFLRPGDIARVLGLHVSWDGAVQAVRTTSGDAVGKVQIAGSFTSGPSVLFTHYPNIKVYLDGDEILVEVYGSEGSIYISLSDVAAALGVVIDILPPVEINIPDPNFYAAVLEILDKPDGYVITSADVEGITNLDVNDLNIADLTGIEYFTALTELSVSNNQLTELDISSNTELIQLDCSGNYMISEDKVIGFNGTWDDSSYTFHPQNVYTVTFKDHDGATLKTQVVVPGTAAAAPASPTRTGYTFSGWDKAFANVTENLTVTAQYTPEQPPVTEPPVTEPPVTEPPATDPPPVTPPPTSEPPPTPAPPIVTVEADEDGSATLTNNQLNEIRQERMALEIEFKDGDGEELGSVVFSPEAAGRMISDATGGSVTVSMKALDAGELLEDAELAPEIAEAIADRPVYEFTVTDANDRPISRFGGAVTVTLPYTLGEEENPNAIVVYYLGAAGTLDIMRGYYDAERKAVVFTTTHFSRYVIAYNPIPYTDIPSGWAKDAVEFAAARGYIAGLTGTLFEPGRAATRGEFTAMLMNAYGVALDETAADNFSDVDADAPYALHLATAKKLGIVAGAGGDIFAPERTITRQEMFALLYNILSNLGELPEEREDGKDLPDFPDAEEVSPYLADAIGYLLRSGVMEGGDGGNLLPATPADRAQTAQMIYNLLTR